MPPRGSQVRSAEVDGEMYSQKPLFELDVLTTDNDADPLPIASTEGTEDPTGVSTYIYNEKPIPKRYVPSIDSRPADDFYRQRNRITAEDLRSGSKD